MIQPYVGVTGFMSAYEVSEVLKAVPDGTQRKLMVGALASPKTIQGIPNSKPGRYPYPEEIAEIFVDHPAALNLVHFHTKNQEKLLEQMLVVTALGGKNCHGLQLNVKWPDPRTLCKYKMKHPAKVIVLQCGSGALESMGNDAEKLAQVSLGYEGICDYLLIDPSGGEAKLFDPHKGFEYLQCLNALIKEMKFVIAGGLSPETLYLLEPIARAFPDTSNDAEGRLRGKNDCLDVARAREFVSRSYELFSKVGK